MARQLLQKIQAQTPRVVSLRRGVGRFSFASKERVYEHHSQENLADL